MASYYSYTVYDCLEAASGVKIEAHGEVPKTVVLQEST